MSAGGGNQLISVLPEELKFLCNLSLPLLSIINAYMHLGTII